MKNIKGKNIVVVGATGAVGQEMIKCLFKTKFPIKKLRLIASENSAGKKILTPFGKIEIETLSEKVFKESDIALFSCGSDLSKEWRQRVVKSKCLMIDNSSAFRYDDTVPLVIPQINPKSALKNNGVISNPNCTTAILAMALFPIYKAFGLKKVIVSTYQATSGAGAKGMMELIEQTGEILRRSRGDLDNLLKLRLKGSIFAHQIAFNLIPHIDVFQENLYTKEEMKVAWETHKIFGDKKIKISCTAVRIPTLRAHSESVTIETVKKVDLKAIRSILSKSQGVKLVDNPAKLQYPMPVNASGNFDVEVGRIRKSLVFGEYGLDFFVSGDQLLRGAALNAVEIAKLFI
ncbi:MAG: aspartate-semialdehyde dehydrogenase [Candidatus Gracilibacteria bacterium]|jgi:aspartate-semialdehyde dehydrogenase